MNLFRLAASLTLDTDDYDKGLNDSEGKTKTFGQKLKSGLGTAAAATGAALTAASAAVVAFGTASIKTGKEFDSSMSQIAATLGFTMEDIENNANGAGDAFAALRAKALEMGSATNYTASQAAEGLNILAMSGYDAESSIGMIEDVLHLAAAGSMDLASAAGYVSGAMKGFNDATKDSGYYADLMAKGATLANTSVQQLGEAMSSGAAGAAAYGQEADSMTVALLRLAEQGEVGAAAGTALSAAMKNLYTPTDQAQKVLEQLGIAAYDSEGNARDFNTVVNELSSALSGYTAEEQAAYKQTIFGIQGLDAYNKMTVTGIDKQKQWAAALAAASDGAGEAAKQYNTMTDNLQGDIDIFNSAVDGLKIGVSDKLMPSVREFVQFGSEAVSTLSAAFSEGGLDGAVTAMGKILTDGIAMVTRKLPQVISLGMKLLTSLLTGIIDNLPLVAETVLEIIEQVGASIGELMPVLIPSIVEALVTVGTILLEHAPELLGVVLQIMEGLAQGIIDAIPNIVEALPEVVSGIVGFFTEAIPMIIETGVSLLSALVSALPEIIAAIVAVLPQIINSIIDTIISNIPLLIQAGVSLLTALVGALPTIINTILAALPTIINSILTALLNNIPLLVNAGIQLLTSLIRALPQIITTIVAALPQIISSIVSTLIENIPLIIEAGITLLIALVEAIPVIIVELVKALPQIITAIVNALGEGFAKMAEVGKNLLRGIWEGISNAAEWLWNKVKEWAGNLLGKLKSFLGIHSPSSVFREVIGKNIAFGLGDGIKKYGDYAVDAMTEVAKDVLAAAEISPEDMFTAEKFATAGVFADTGRYGSGLQIVNNVYAEAQTPSEIFAQVRRETERVLWANGSRDRRRRVNYGI